MSEAFFSLSNTLSSDMVLQRAPSSAVLWGFGTPGVVIRTHFRAMVLEATVSSAGVWRQHLPPQPGSLTPVTLLLNGSAGGHITLERVLFGDVYLCSGQSNMQFTPRNGMNNLTAEIMAADAYGDGIRLFTVGNAETDCRVADCSRPFEQLEPPQVPRMPRRRVRRVSRSKATTTLMTMSVPADLPEFGRAC